MKIDILGNPGIYCTNKCFDCCCDSVSVYPNEARRISEMLELPMNRAFYYIPGKLCLGVKKSHETGNCIFSSEDGCKIHKKDATAKPHVCRTYPLFPEYHIQDDKIVIILEDFRMDKCRNVGIKHTMKKADFETIAKDRIRSKITVLHTPPNSMESMESYTDEFCKIYNNMTFEKAIAFMNLAGMEELS